MVGATDPPFARDALSEANKIKLKSYRGKKRKREIRIKVAINVAIKVVIVLEKFIEKKSIQDVNFLAIWGFQIQGNGMSSGASTRNPPT